MTLSSSTFSQSTSTRSDSTKNKYPKSVLQGKDTLIVFKIDQARTMAKDLETKKAQDTIIVECEKKNDTYVEVIKKQELQIGNLQEQISNHERIDSARVNQIKDLEQVATIQEKEIKKEKRKRKLVIAGSIVAEVLTVLAFVIL